MQHCSNCSAGELKIIAAMGPNRIEWAGRITTRQRCSWQLQAIRAGIGRPPMRQSGVQRVVWHQCARPACRTTCARPAARGIPLPRARPRSAFASCASRRTTSMRRRRQARYLCRRRCRGFRPRADLQRHRRAPAPPRACERPAPRRRALSGGRSRARGARACRHDPLGHVCAGVHAPAHAQHPAAPCWHSSRARPSSPRLRAACTRGTGCA